MDSHKPTSAPPRVLAARRESASGGRSPWGSVGGTGETTQEVGGRKGGGGV